MSRNLFNYQDKALHFSDLNLSELSAVKNYTEPVIIYKKSLLHERIDWLKSWPSLKRLHFAMKSNFNPMILKEFLASGCGLDVVSLGEIQAGLNAGFSVKDFIFSGVGKTYSELDFAIKNDIYQINVESVSELRRISEIADKYHKNVDVGLRINPLIDAQTHPYVATALKDSKFGIQADDISECLDIIKNNSKIRFKCLSFHIGSQITDVRIFQESILKMKKLFNDLRPQFSELDRFDIGGGLGLDYHQHDTEADFLVFQQLQKVCDEVLKDLEADVLSEMGRFLVARAGIFICQVQYIKNQNMLVLDLGMNNNLRPSLYQSHHHFFNLNQKSNQKKDYSIVGPLCESSDQFHKSFPLYQVSELDLLVKADVGAYVRSMASQYNLKNIAQEIIVD